MYGFLNQAKKLNAREMYLIEIYPSSLSEAPEALEAPKTMATMASMAPKAQTYAMGTHCHRRVPDNVPRALDTSCHIESEVRDRTARDSSG